MKHTAELSLPHALYTLEAGLGRAAAGQRRHLAARVFFQVLWVEEP